MSAAKKKPEPDASPQWAGRHPFAPGDKKPFLLTRETPIPRVYGEPPHQVATRLHVSTDKLTCTEFAVAPGEYFSPPDIHTGDEVYYVLAGTATVLDPETGEVFTAAEGDVMLIPKGAWHQTFNFTDKELVLLCSFAPEVWSGGDQGATREFKGEARFYKTAEGGV